MISQSRTSLLIDFSAKVQSMSVDYSNLRRALVRIADVSATEWRRSGETPLDSGLRTLEAEFLDRKLPQDADQIEIPLPDVPQFAFLLPPTPESVTCLLSVKWAFASKRARNRAREARQRVPYIPRVFRVFLIPSHATGPVTPTVVRFDEAEDNKSWCFAHAQLCDTLTPYGHLPPLTNATSWLSARLPRIPLAAPCGPAPILVCILASLYGIDSPLLTQVLRKLHDQGSRKVAKELGWNQSGVRATIRGGGR